MKPLVLLLGFCLSLSSAGAKEIIYIGSTPAGNTVRSFLGIPLSDSVDFVRWKIAITGNEFILSCNYGIGQPNTTGFIGGGKKIELKGVLHKEKNYYQLMNGNNMLKILEINTNLLHLLDADNQLLTGNGGWSYTLNNNAAAVSDDVSVNARSTPLKDSITFIGRSPCAVPGVVPAGKLCYKLKWKIVFYTDPVTHQPSTCRVFGTRFRAEGGKNGGWKITNGKNGRIIYELYDDQGNTYLRLLKLDENILLFTDAAGNLLTGDADYSYTLSRTI